MHHIMTPEQIWQLESRNRIAQGFPPLLPGQTTDTDQVSVPEGFDRPAWVEHCRTQARKGELIPTPVEFMQQQQQSPQVNRGRDLALAVDQYRNSQAYRDAIAARRRGRR